MKTDIHFDHISLSSSYNEKCCWQSCREVHSTRFVFSNLIFENRALYEIIWKHFAVPGGTRMTLRYMRSACCIPMATHTQSEYLMFCGRRIVIYLRNKNQQHALFYSQFISVFNLYMFRAGLLLIIRRWYSVYTATGKCHADTYQLLYIRVQTSTSWRSAVSLLETCRG